MATSIDMPDFRPPASPDAVDGAESGQAIVEAAIVLPAMTFLILTLLQLTMVQHARVMTEYAAYCAARAGIVFNADKNAMKQAATMALLPTMTRTDDLTHVTTGILSVVGVNGVSPELMKRQMFGLPIVDIQTLSPKPGDVSGALGRHLGGNELDFDDIRSAAAHANQLQIEITYFYRMPIPFANQILQSIFFASRPGAYFLDQWRGFDWTRPEVAGMNAQLLARGAYAGSGDPYAAQIVAASMAPAPLGGFYFPLKATYTMRMQSNAFLKNL